MNLYHGNEFIAALPDGLKDKTVHIFSLTDDGPSDLSVVIARDKPKAGETAERFAERILSGLLGRLPLLQVQKRETITVSSVPAVATDYTWQSPEGKMFQRQVILYAKAHHQMLIITATCRGDSMASKWEGMFKELLENFRLRT